MRPRPSGSCWRAATTLAFVSAALAASPGPARALEAGHAGSPDDSAVVVRTVARFHSALLAADSATALGLLAPDVLVLESGDVETLADYRAHHVAADIAFARAVPGTRTILSVHLAGNTAWITSTSVTQGQFEGRAVNSAGAELMVLSRASAGAPWHIRAIHWSSHKRK